MNRQLIVKSYGKNILLGLILSSAIGIALYYGIDKKIIVLSAFIIGVFTELLVGVVALVAAIPLVGPMIIKIVSIPIFWVLNALGTLVSGIAIKKGYATELARGRIMTLALLIGMIIGYIIGNLIPL